MSSLIPLCLEFTVPLEDPALTTSTQSCSRRQNRAKHWSLCLTIGKPTILQNFFIRLQTHFKFFTADPWNSSSSPSWITSNTFWSLGSHLDRGEHSKKPSLSSPCKWPLELTSQFFHWIIRCSGPTYDNSTPSKWLGDPGSAFGLPLFTPLSPETTVVSSLPPKHKSSSLPRHDRGEKEFWASNPGPIGLAVASPLKTPTIGVWVMSLNLRFLTSTLEKPRSDLSVALAGAAEDTGNPKPSVKLAGPAAGTGDPETVSDIPLELSPLAHEDWPSNEALTGLGLTKMPLIAKEVTTGWALTGPPDWVRVFLRFCN